MASALAVQRIAEAKAKEIYDIETDDINLRTSLRDRKIKESYLVRESRIDRILERRRSRIESDYQECLEFVGAEY